MKIARRAPTLGAATLALVLFGAAHAAAQTEEIPLDRERLTQYTCAHRSLNDARDEFHGKVGRLHDEQGRERARQELEQQVAEALESQDLTREEYDALTLIISLDGEARALFDEIMASFDDEETAPPC